MNPARMLKPSVEAVEAPAVVVVESPPAPPAAEPPTPKPTPKKPEPEAPAPEMAMVGDLDPVTAAVLDEIPDRPRKAAKVAGAAPAAAEPTALEADEQAPNRLPILAAAGAAVLAVGVLALRGLAGRRGAVATQTAPDLGAAPAAPAAPAARNGLVIG